MVQGFLVFHHQRGWRLTHDLSWSSLCSHRRARPLNFRPYQISTMWLQKIQPHKCSPTACHLQNEMECSAALGSWEVTVEVLNTKSNLTKCFAHALTAILSHTGLALNCEGDPRATLILRTHQSFCCEQILSDTVLFQMTIPSTYFWRRKHLTLMPQGSVQGACNGWIQGPHIRPRVWNYSLKHRHLRSSCGWKLSLLCFWEQ